ncbi:aminotransferase class IV, partial [Acidocella sp.]|uniref:aminotransferase class IV n=1 Tax=Acidocella sp. TaxID=50710 RepID=UPI002F3FCE96
MGLCRRHSLRPSGAEVFAPLGSKSGRFPPSARPAADRGFQFGDGIYEVVYVQDGRLIDAPLHMARLQRSLREIDILLPLSSAALEVVMREVLRRNRISTGLVYLQISRGVA